MYAYLSLYIYIDMYIYIYTYVLIVICIVVHASDIFRVVQLLRRLKAIRPRNVRGTLTPDSEMLQEGWVWGAPVYILALTLTLC